VTKLAVKKGLEILTSSQNIDALRRLIVMTIVGRNFRPASANEEPTNDDSLSALLSRLPTKSLAEVASISKGKTGIKDALPGPFPLVVTAETRSSADHFDFEGPAVMIPMVSSTGHGDASLKRIHFQDGRYAVGSILAVVHPKDSSVLSARYLHAYLSAFKDELLVSRMVGTANVSLTVAKIGDVPVPLLPIQGQQEIAELMALCDRLEAEQADAASAHARLVDTLLGTLTQSTDAADLAANWQRLAEHFEILFSTEASIDALKQTILQLAVMGKLVPQDPHDEPASGLLKQIATEKDRLSQVEGLRTTAEPRIEADEQYMAIPDGWQFQRLGNLAKFIDYRGKTPDKINAGVPLITAKNVRFGFISREPYEFVSEKEYTDWMTRGFPRLGDILFTTEAPLGNAAIVDISEKFALAQRVICFQFHEPQIANYLLLALMSKQVRHQIEGEATGMTATGIKASRLKEIPMPIPPLAEQHRIVAKVDELMTLCDRLKADLGTAHQHQATLADTLIESALEAA